MRPWMANLLGLAIGFALAGAALLYFLPQLRALDTTAPPRQVASIDPDQPAIPPPAPLPRIAEPDQPAPDTPAAPPLPNIVQPEAPDRTIGASGTGFFIAEDGTLLTAAHVVRDCHRMQVVSRLVRLSPATLLASDTKDDMALLQVSQVRPPAILPLGDPAAVAGPVFVLGYPATAGLKVPEETWGTLENGNVPRAAGRYADPGYLVWMQARAVTHGYSGGPILDPRNGEVVGLVKGTISPGTLKQMPRMPGVGVAIGPGSARLIGFVREQAPWLGVTDVSAEGDDAVALARRATVHVFCWY